MPVASSITTPTVAVGVDGERLVTVGELLTFRVTGVGVGVVCAAATTARELTADTTATN